MGLVRRLHVNQVVLVRLKVPCWRVFGYGTRKRCTCVCRAGGRAWACGLADLHLHHLHLRLLHGLRLRHHGLPHHHGLHHGRAPLCRRRRAQLCGRPTEAVTRDVRVCACPRAVVLHARAHAMPVTFVTF